jgi:hypothetical protein
LLKTIEAFLEDFDLVLEVRDLVTLSIDLSCLKVKFCGFLLFLCQLKLQSSNLFKLGLDQLDSLSFSIIVVIIVFSERRVSFVRIES